MTSYVNDPLVQVAQRYYTIGAVNFTRNSMSDKHISATKQAGKFRNIPILLPLLQHVPTRPAVPGLLPALLRSGTAVQSDGAGTPGPAGTIQ